MSKTPEEFKLLQKTNHKEIITNGEVCIKKYSKKWDFSETIFQNESDMMQLIYSIDSNLCPKLLKKYVTERDYILVMEYCGDDLFNLRLKLKNKKEIMSKALKIIKKLHDNNIVHTDIKLENFVYNEETDSLKIIDFSETYIVKKKYIVPCGTILYKPEEFLIDGETEKHSDIWSLGVMMVLLSRNNNSSIEYWNNNFLWYELNEFGVLKTKHRGELYRYFRNVIKYYENKKYFNNFICSLENRKKYSYENTIKDLELMNFD